MWRAEDWLSPVNLAASTRRQLAGASFSRAPNGRARRAHVILVAPCFCPSPAFRARTWHRRRTSHSSASVPPASTVHTPHPPSSLCLFLPAPRHDLRTSFPPRYSPSPYDIWCRATSQRRIQSNAGDALAQQGRRRREGRLLR